MFKVASLVAVLTLLSKILGLARDLVIAKYFGTSMYADAFNMAYLFTGNIFIIFGGIGGPLYSSVVAVAPKINPKKTWEFIKKLIYISFLIFFSLALALFIFKANLLEIFVDPIKKTEYFNITLKNINILLPLLIITGPIGIVFAILNIYKKYFEPSLSPAIVNIILIATVFIMGDTNSGLALAIGTSLGGVLSLFIQIPSLAGINNKLKIEDETNENTEEIPQNTLEKEFQSILYPALLSTGGAQLLVLVDSYFCKTLAEGSWTSLLLANRLIQMPLGILLTAMLVPVFPEISKLVKENNIPLIKHKIWKVIKFLVAICIPGIIIGMFLSEDLVRLIFERGAFDARSTEMVSSLFFYLCLSIIPYVLRDTFTRTLYSFGDSKTPLYIMLVGIAIKFIANTFLVPKFGLDGIAFSTIVVSIFNFVILSYFVNKKLS